MITIQLTSEIKTTDVMSKESENTKISVGISMVILQYVYLQLLK